ncbi:hypothetical protein [Sulfurimonas sp.]|uniref:hypothetical protein n=1 Tax=Sulfurimonas sp. TaxID=2022749 RepID=UPI002B49069E|nr:hypothetical protein [Sulfurimonas sp.]
MNKKLVELEGATLQFKSFEEDGLVFYEYDARECQPPEPMVNTIRGLSLLKNKTDRLVGFFFHEPFPLYQRIPLTISHRAEELEDGDFKITFKLES